MVKSQVINKRKENLTEETYEILKAALEYRSRWVIEKPKHRLFGLLVRAVVQRCCFNSGRDTILGNPILTPSNALAKGLKLKIGPTLIEDTFAEAFTMKFVRIVVTAADEFWLDAGLQAFCGYGTSVIGCDAEIGVEKRLAPNATDDERIGAAVLAFGFSNDALEQAMINRIGQCVMTCPSTAVFDGNRQEESIDVGAKLRYFGDGFQKSKLIDDRRFWRIPVMDGEFVVEESVGIAKGVAGGNFLIQSDCEATGLAASRKAVEAIDELDGVILPFPGGVVRSGSKVGSKYKALRASTYDQYCPTLRGNVETKIVEGANCVHEIVIDGIDFDSVAKAMNIGISAACGEGVIAIAAGNYGGSLGKHHFQLREVMSKT